MLGCALLRSLPLDPYSSPIPHLPTSPIHISRVLLSRIPTVIGITVIGGSTATDIGITIVDTGLINMAGIFLLTTIKRPREDKHDDQDEKALFNIDECADRRLIENCFGNILLSDSNTAMASRSTRVVAFMDPILAERESQEIGHRNFVDR